MDKKLYKITNYECNEIRYVRMTPEQEVAMAWMVDFIAINIEIEEVDSLEIEEI